VRIWRSAALQRALTNTWTSARAGLPARLSISERLGIAFAAVTFLAIAANLMVEHGRTALLIATRRVPYAVRVPVPVMAPAPAPVRISTPEEPEPEQRPDERATVQALRELEREVTRQAMLQAPENRASLQNAATQLDSQAEAFGARVMRNAPDMHRRLASIEADGSALVAFVQARHALSTSFAGHLDALDSQVKTALDGSWKIFGRVIARQSLISLNRALDGLRRSASSVAASGNSAPSPETLDAVALAQRRFATEVENNVASLERSQGAPWVAQLRQNLEQLQSDTGQIAALYKTAVPTLSGFQGSVEDLATALHQAAAATVPRHSPAAAPAAVVAPPPEPLLADLSSATTPPPVVPAAPPPPPEDHLQLIIGVISGAVLLLVFVISAATVRSIARPIRAFLLTTEQLAAGELQARFAPTGVRELDVLATAFNRMAEKLAAAQEVTREHQAHLELRVDERTRQLQHLAEHDPLTGLPNRRQLMSHLEASLRVAGGEGSQVAVFFLDLDNFKNINDSMDHAFGDLVLKAVAQRLRDTTAGTAFAARLGGDEFTVIHRSAAGLAALTELGEQLVTAFQRPLLIEGRELLVSASVGASIYPNHEVEPDALLRAADAALFEAKSHGRSRLSLFSQDLLANASLKFRTEQSLRRAVDRGDWELLFQPEVRFDSLSVKLAEALLRWRLPDGRLVSPPEFLTVAEDSGLITSINEWVLRSAIEHTAHWHHGAWPEARIAVNVTARQLLDLRFVDRVVELLEEYKVPPRCMEIELTETVLQTGQGTIETLRRLRELGISVALDDFGAGYSSLASLEQLPLTRVKLDRSLIATIDSSARSLAIARSIIGLCASLELEVTAEGIERREQLALLLAYPQLSLQGFLLSHPLTGAALPAFIANVSPHLQGLLLDVPSAAATKTAPAERQREYAG
jgi:diguanylate cyclase (GGDEF)-like protein